MYTRAHSLDRTRTTLRGLRRGGHALVALTLFGSLACGDDGEGGVTGPPEPGAITVSTQTTGFNKDDGYELFVNGESHGTVGANEEVTLAEVDAGTYELTLGDVAGNCTAEATSVTVVEAQTATATVAIVCAAPDPTPYSIRASRDRPDLEAGTLVECSFGICPSDDAWDIWAEFDSQSDPQAIIRQNQVNGAELAFVGVVLSELTEEHVTGATFSADLTDTPFDPSYVVLVRTSTGNVYALGNPVENTLMLTLTFDAVLLVNGS